MTIRTFVLVFVALAFSSINASAEIYRDIKPGSTLASLKEQFPGASFRYVQTAWADKGESLFEVSGPGLPGKMMIKLTDTSLFYQQRIADLPPEEVEEWERELAISNDESRTVDWVRYVPSAPIPVERLIAKYGPAEQSGFSEDDFSPYKSWESKGVFAALRDNAKEVLYIDYTFTLYERCISDSEKYSFSAEKCKAPSKPAPAKKKK